MHTQKEDARREMCPNVYNAHTKIKLVSQVIVLGNMEVV